MTGEPSLMWAKERWHKCIDRQTVYALPGCRKGCKHASIEMRVSNTTCSLCQSTFVHTEVSPNCARLTEYQERREEIFQRGINACEELIPNNFRHGHSLYLKIVAEYYELPCPLFEPTEIL